jgi:predicted Zn finger-like uncharacterized protein
MPSMIVDCPSCTRKLRVTEELIGREVKCPTCGSTFQATAGNVTRQPTPRGLVSEEAASPPPAGLGASVKDAPGVASDYSAQEGTEESRELQPLREEEPEDLNEERSREEPRHFRGRRDAEPHRGALILILGILSIVLLLIGLPLGIAALIMGRRDLQKIRARAMDPEGEGTTQAGWICGIIGTILQSLACLGCMTYIAVVVALVSGFSKSPPITAPARPQPKRGGPPQKRAQTDLFFQELRDYLPGPRC